MIVANVMLEPAYCEKGRVVARDDDDDDRGPSRCFLRLEVVVAEGGLEPAVCCMLDGRFESLGGATEEGEELVAKHFTSPKVSGSGRKDMG